MVDRLLIAYIPLILRISELRVSLPLFFDFIQELRSHMKRKFFLALLLMIIFNPFLPGESSAEKAGEPSAYEKFNQCIKQVLHAKNKESDYREAIEELRMLDGPDSFKKVSKTSLKLIDHLEQSACFSLFSATILAPGNDFLPIKPEEDGYTSFRDLRSFTDCYIAYGWQQNSLGRNKEACEIFCNLIKFGSLLSSKGDVMSSSIGVSLGLRGTEHLKTIFDSGLAAICKKTIQKLLRDLPRPAIDFKGMISNERKKVEWMLDYTKKNLSSWRKRNDIPWLGEGASPEQKCVAYQALLQFAIIVMATDNAIDNRYETHDIEKIKEEIIKLTSLEKFPVCPSGKEYNIGFGLNNVKNLCSIHPMEGPLPSGVVMDKSFSFGPMPLECLAIVDTPQFEIQVNQAINYLDSLSKLSPIEPDAASKAVELKQRYLYQDEGKKLNLVIKSMAPLDYWKSLKNIGKLQNKIDALR